MPPADTNSSFIATAEGIVKLWKISQSVNDDYDTYDSAIVVAADAADAKKIHPGEIPKKLWWTKPDRYGTWASQLEDVTAEEIGEAAPHLTAGMVVCSSFNAG